MLTYDWARMMFLRFNAPLPLYTCMFLFRRFVSAFIDFPKPLIGLINGPAVGVSVTVLGLFDAVYASDKVLCFWLPQQMGLG